MWIFGETPTRWFVRSSEIAAIFELKRSEGPSELQPDAWPKCRVILNCGQVITLEGEAASTLLDHYTDLETLRPIEIRKPLDDERASES